MERTRWRALVPCIGSLVLACAGCGELAQPPDPPTQSDTQSVLVSSVGTVRWFVLEVADGSNPGTPYINQQTYLHVANANPNAVRVQANFQGDGGSWSAMFGVPAMSRVSKSVAELNGAGSHFNTAELYSLDAGNEIRVSATEFSDSTFGPSFWEASMAVNGATDPRNDWYFGEGGAYGIYPPIGGPVFDHRYIVYNPNPFPISVNYQLYPDEIDHGNLDQIYPDPVHTIPSHVVAPSGRLVFNPYAELAPGVALGSRAAVVHCSSPCFSQMVMSQLPNVPGRRPNLQSSLGSSPAVSWNVIGIATQAWQNRIYIVNPNGVPSTITAVYYNAAGVPISVSSHTIKALHRIGYDLNATTWDDGSGRDLAQAPQGLDGGSLSLQLTATAPIALTKITYWGRDFDWSEGASTTSHSQGGFRVILPGGNTGGGSNPFSNLTQVMNVGGAGTTIRATVLTPGGPCAVAQPIGFLNPHGVLQVTNSACPGYLGNFATVFDSDSSPIVAESTNLLGPDSVPDTRWRSGDAVEGLIFSTATSSVPIQP